eukprot:TRINITY_DN245_c1_g2_i1.p1 TRINITY_DN245_c1_g2~~TRINITY_DN245_c1_g2_i1.p1  ORF type:complete len:231 (+),score=16.27 TRINITY_DN245_c1_g2_i1:432-1124(+)
MKYVLLIIYLSLCTLLHAQTQCISQTDCASTEYCQYPAGTCGGSGFCTKTPQICTKEYRPVCGCNNITYSNPCMASAVNISIQYSGPCLPDDRCAVNSDCNVGEYCTKGVGDCDGKGHCVAKPDICTMLHDPVCGCDGVTHGNPCMAAARGVNVLYRGECSTVCTSDAACPVASFCQFLVGECRGSGRCLEPPVFCFEIYQPVCGCDGRTYSNECEAQRNLVSIKASGEC